MDRKVQRRTGLRTSSPNPTAHLVGVERSIVAVNPPGRHRAPGRFNPLTELRLLAKETAQPAVKGAAIVAATGGLIATVAPTANASETGAVVAVAAKAAAVPAAVGPKAAAPLGSNALSAIGFTAPTTTTVAAPTKKVAPRYIADVVLEQQRAAAKAKAEALAKARREAQARASRTASRTTLTKTTTNTYATSGKRSSYNWATQGQCTWGALAKWKASEGYYPGGWTGNAMVWDTGAASAGYTVSGTPRTRSIVVFEPGVEGASSVGHVAWVTGVSGDQVTIIEMNALAGPYNYNTRTVTDQAGMKYIYAP
jgi:surface antigen